MLIHFWDQLLTFLSILIKFEGIIWYVLLTSLVFRFLFPERGKSKRFLIILACALILPVEVPRIAFDILAGNCINSEAFPSAYDTCKFYVKWVVGAHALILLMPFWAKIFAKKVYKFEMGIGMWVFYYFIGVLIPKIFLHLLI